MIEDIKCRDINSTLIFRNNACRTVQSICEENLLNWGGVRDQCLDNIGQPIPLSDVITRTLAAEQFF